MAITVSLHLMEPDRAGGWRLHFFVVDVAALTLLDELTEGACGPGDPVSFNPEEFVSERFICLRMTPILCRFSTLSTPIRCVLSPRTFPCQN